MASLQSVQELVANLAEYQGQLQQVEKLLLGDPENAELTDMYTSLAEVIQLTEDLLKEAQQGQQDASTSAADQAGASSSGAEQHQQPGEAASAGDLNLPASVADQIKKAQVRAALLGQADATWAIGAKCQAQYSADGQFYVATVEAVSEAGNFVVVFDGYGDKEEVAKSSVRPIEEVEEGYTGVAAPKRKRVEEEPTITEIPKWLQIKDTDDEKTKDRKKKLLKSYKSKIRFQNMDLKQKEKQDNWQSFIKGKGSKKKTGFLTGTKKESMFKVPDGLGSKVGVIGSGKGMTDFQKKARHEYELDE